MMEIARSIVYLFRVSRSPIFGSHGVILEYLVKNGEFCGAEINGHK